MCSSDLLTGYGQTLSIAIVVMVITYLSLIAGELVPKRIALNNAEAIASFAAPIMRSLSKATAPFVWLLGVIALVPVIGPVIVKILSIGFIWLLNAIGYLVSYVAIRRGYSKDVLTYRGLTIAVIIGIVIGFVLGKLL